MNTENTTENTTEDVIVDLDNISEPIYTEDGDGNLKEITLDELIDDEEEVQDAITEDTE